MTYAPRSLEVWEHVVSFTVVEAPFEIVEPLAASVIRARQGPSGAIRGERRPPMMVLDHMQKQAEAGKDALGASLIFEGVLIYAPAEAQLLTVIEHPLDDVTSDGFPPDLARVMPDTPMITFDSNLETTARTFHGISARQGSKITRRVHLSKGFETSGWHWEEDGDPLPFEDASRLQKKRIWERLDRTLVYDYAAKLGLSSENTLFGRNFASSVYYYPLAHDQPEAIAFNAQLSPKAAREAGVESPLPSSTTDAEFPETASIMGAMQRWEQSIDKARVGAWRSDANAKTPKGRERAQWRVIEAAREVSDEMQQYDIADKHIALYLGQLTPPMRALGTKSEAYRAWKDLTRNSFWTFWRR